MTHSNITPYLDICLKTTRTIDVLKAQTANVSGATFNDVYL